MVTVRLILLCGSEAWPMKADDIRRLMVFESRCLRLVDRIWHVNFVSNLEVRPKLLGLVLGSEQVDVVGSCFVHVHRTVASLYVVI